MTASSEYAIHDLYLNHRESLIHLLFRMVGCRATAEDLAQEAYLRLMDAAEEEKVRHPQPFLYQIGRNLALDHLRREKVRHRTDTAEEDPETVDQIPSPAPGPERAALALQETDRLLDALHGLSERRRQILLLHKLHHWNYDRIAAHLGISRSAVEKNLYAAMAHLLAHREE